MIPDLPNAEPRLVLSARGCQPRRDHAPFDLTVHAGQAVCLLGDDSSGAREAWRVLAELDVPLRGAVIRYPDESVLAGHTLSVHGPDPYAPWWDRRRLVEVLSAVTARSGPHDLDATSAMLRAFALEGVAQRRVHDLTPGERRRFRFARAFLARPAVLMTLEPAAGLDVTSARQVLDGLTQARRHTGAAVVWMGSDPLAAAGHAEEVLVFWRGRVIRQGPSEEVLPPAGAGLVEMEIWGECDAFVRRVAQEPWVVSVAVLGRQGPARLAVVVTDTPRALYQLPRLAVALDVTPQSCRSQPLTLDALLRETQIPG